MIRYAATLMFAVSAVALGASENMSRINGSLRVEAGRQAGDVSTVNGSITLETGTSAREVETVNGSVRLESHAAALGQPSAHLQGQVGNSWFQARDLFGDELRPIVVDG